MQARKKRPRVDQYAQQRAEFGQLFVEVAAILFEHDPAGINFGTNSDEYEPEVAGILPQLKDARSEADVRKIVHSVLTEMFEGIICDPEERFQALAEEIWQAWQRRAARAI